jgi:hypothetical protein
VLEDLVAQHPQLADRAGSRRAAVDKQQILLGPVGAQGEASMPWSAVVPSPSFGSSTTAPAPSPNSTQVPRSLQSIRRVMVSAPITSAHLAWPRATKPSATLSA